MNTKSIAFIGGGRITRIILQAFKNKKIEFKNIVVNESNNDTSEKLKAQFPQVEISDLEQCAIQDIVFVALHPPVILETLDKISPFITEKCVIISLAPKIKTAVIADKLKTKKIVRLIPNATSVMNIGYNPVCFSGTMLQSEKSEIFELLGILGDTFEVAEQKLEAYAIVSAMAPTYFWFQWEKLCEIGEEIGLEREEARKAVYETLMAALTTLFKSGMTFKEVFDLIPVKPLADNEKEIAEIYNLKLKGLYTKLSS